MDILAHFQNPVEIQSYFRKVIDFIGFTYRIGMWNSGWKGFFNLHARDIVEARIYVGNLPFKTTDEELRKLFEQYGEVKAADVIRYKKSGRSKGYAFVVLSEADSQNAVQNLNDKEYEGRVIKVRIAKPRENFPRENQDKSDGSDSESDKFKTMRIGIDWHWLNEYWFLWFCDLPELLKEYSI